VQRNDCERIGFESRVVARPIVASPARRHFERGAVCSSNRWSNARSGAVTAAFGVMLWFGGGTFDLTAAPEHEIVSQPTAARSHAEPAPVLTGLSNESLDEPASDSRTRTRAERAERRKARKEAARAKRAEARENRASTAQERREAYEAKRAAAHERRAAALASKREAADARREASQAKHEAARERYAARVQARHEAAEARREARRQKHELAKARREGREPDAEHASESFSSSESAGPSAYSMASDAASGSGNPGILRINSLPWAQVFVDGRMVGYTPQRNISLSPGDHDVRLVNPAFQMRKSLHVQIAQGQQVTRSEILED
jgi:hypothetical protein